jgi:hypothetical protein
MWGATVVMRTICSFSIVLALLATSGLPLQGSLRSEGLRQCEELLFVDCCRNGRELFVRDGEATKKTAGRLEHVHYFERRLSPKCDS